MPATDVVEDYFSKETKGLGSLPVESKEPSPSTLEPENNLEDSIDRVEVLTRELEERWGASMSKGEFRMIAALILMLNARDEVLDEIRQLW